MAGRVVIGMLLFLLVGMAPASAQVLAPPHIELQDNLIGNGNLRFTEIVAPEPGWIALYADDEGRLGPLVGVTALRAGVNRDVRVRLDLLSVTPFLHAYLHVDDHQPGVFENATNHDADPYQRADGELIYQDFPIYGIQTWPQKLGAENLYIGAVISHWDAELEAWTGSPGITLGVEQFNAGTTLGLIIPLDDEQRLSRIELVQMSNPADVSAFNRRFGLRFSDLYSAVQTAPNDVVMTTGGQPLSNTPLPFMTALPRPMPEGEITVNVGMSTLPLWVEVRADMNGQPGRSLGAAHVPAGSSGEVVVSIDTIGLDVPLATVWPVLHVDDGETGVYEYLQVPNADLPLVINGRLVTFPVEMTNSPNL